jgi:hypothetical protein
LLGVHDVAWMLRGSSPEESLNGVGKESLVGGAVAVAHGGQEERGCEGTQRSMTKVVDAIASVRSSRSDGKVRVPPRPENEEK